MRVITGKARGRKLQTLPGEDVRPTSDRVKEAVFSIIQFDIEGRRFLDLFAGSGQMGIEALSRGAKSAVFVDAFPAAISIVKKNLENTGLQENAAVYCTDSLSFLNGVGEVFDIAYIDPPYHKGLLPQALERVEKRMSPAGIILCEHPSNDSVPESAGAFRVVRRYPYAKIAVTLYRRIEENT